MPWYVGAKETRDGWDHRMHMERGRSGVEGGMITGVIAARHPVGGNQESRG